MFLQSLHVLHPPSVLTKLGYLIDNPWSNALDRARQAGEVMAAILIKRSMGVRPVTLIGFSLGARVVFYTLVALAKQKAFGIVQEVYLMGATVTASRKTWREVRGVVSGRFVNCYARNDWVLGYLFRATTGGLSTVAGLRPVEYVPDLENVDITDLLAGHMSYRSLMPVLLAEVGFRVTADRLVYRTLRPQKHHADFPRVYLSTALTSQMTLIGQIVKCSHLSRSSLESKRRRRRRGCHGGRRTRQCQKHPTPIVNRTKQVEIARVNKPKGYLMILIFRHGLPMSRSHLLTSQLSTLARHP